jgi:hypothetical protein
MNAKQAAIPNAKRACYVCEGTRRLVSISQLLYVLGTGRDGIGTPDVIGDAWLPPFGRDTFDVVILDPPYMTMKQQEKKALLRAAAWISRKTVVWFHTVWIATDRRLPLRKAWFIRVGDQCAMRCLQFFDVDQDKLPPVQQFERGPALKYNRWLRGEQQLSFAGGQIIGSGAAPASKRSVLNRWRSSN